ncbi:MAG: prepilin-type N-terminal cleavage/methylation domain-containing protein, partial [Anaerolineales bacterium]|nr:prepilin-type N-terminal cleavage/methylation domain-containing protein [Anaerolineales bacterium]
MKRLHSNRRQCSCPGLRNEAGVTLIELMIYMVLASVVMGAIYSMMITQTRAYADQRQITDAQETVSGAAVLLTSELRQIAPSDGDLYFIAPESLAIRSVQSVAIVCAIDQVLRRFALWNLVGELEDFQKKADSAFIFSAGGAGQSDDKWEREEIKGFFKVAGGPLASCEWAVPQTPDTIVQLDKPMPGVVVGAPFRSFRAIQYGTFLDGGNWWLGRKTPGPGGAYEILTGPLRSPAAGGLVFKYYDATGNVTAVPADVRMIEIVIRSQSTRQSRQASGLTERTDSIRTKV